MSPFEYAGLGTFVAGAFLETFSELQRRWFKKKPESLGKLYTGGLFSWAQHINFFGYTLWRTGETEPRCLILSGEAMLTGDLYLSAAIPAFFSFTFLTNNIPELQNRLAKKYGKLFQEYSAKTAKFVPFLY